MTIIQKLKYSQNWNIGFADLSSCQFIRQKALGAIQWMKHPYHDRWYADPFILRSDENRIVLFVEECSINKPKGIICELVVDRKTKELLERHVLLELDSHLSYPAIIRHNGKVYSYPENGASGMLNLYEYDERSHSLINPVCILNEAVADSTIIEYGGKFYLIATRYPETQEKAFLYSSESLFGPFHLAVKNPIQFSRDSSRPGGNWVVCGSDLFRPSQDCLERYGAALSIMSIHCIGESYSETKYCRINPVSRRYNLGIHTINFDADLCVIDGYGYLYPIMFFVANCVKKIKQILNNQK